MLFPQVVAGGFESFDHTLAGASNFVGRERAVVGAQGQAEGHALLVRRKREDQQKLKRGQAIAGKLAQFVFQVGNERVHRRDNRKIEAAGGEAAQRTICLAL